MFKDQGNTGTALGGKRIGRVVLGAAAVAWLLAGPAGPVFAQQAGGMPQEPFGLGTPAEPCVVCHSLEEGGPFRVAPNLWDIVGSEKARDREWFGYTMALRTKGGTWTEDELSAFLEDAGEFAPGSSKSIRIRDAERRQEIIDYLKTLR